MDKTLKEKTKKNYDQWIKPWLEWRNQQELSGGVLKVSFLKKLCKIRREIPVLESLFNQI